VKKNFKPISCSLVAIFALSIAVSSPKVGPFGVDSVSAATVVTPAPTTPKPTTPTTTPKPTTSTSSSTTSISITRLLTLNSVGEDVKLLQTNLSSKGYKLTVDGIFGKLTFAAVRDYQGKNGLVVDGIVGPATLAKLNIKPVTTPVATQPTTKGNVNVTTSNYQLTNTKIIGNVTVSAENFTMSKNAKVEGNVYFTTQQAKDTFKIDATSAITGSQVLTEIDAVATASLVRDEDAFVKAISKEGSWIPCILNDLTTTKELVLEGMFKKAATDTKAARKIGLYSQDDKHVVTRRFTLTAPKLTIASPEAKIQGGTFKGKLVVASRNFLLTDTVVVGDVYVHSTEFKLEKNTKIQGNIYFDNMEAQKTFIMDASCSITGNQILAREPEVLDVVASASLVDNAADFEKAISKNGTWIICPIKDIAINKDLVLEGEGKKLDTKAVPPVETIVARKIGLYYHDADNYTTAKFTLTAPSLTVKTKATIQKGTFIGDLYIASEGVTLKETKIIGNVYFATQAIMDAFENPDAKSMDSLSSITGTKAVKVK